MLLHMLKKQCNKNKWGKLETILKQFYGKYIVTIVCNANSEIYFISLHNDSPESYYSSHCNGILKGDKITMFENVMLFWGDIIFLVIISMY